MATNAGNSTVKHPLYTTWSPTWLKARDVYEGSGGFLDPDCPYLVPHPREWLDHSIDATEEVDGERRTIGKVPNPTPTQPSPKLKLRRKLARYENVADTILDAVMSPLFEEPAQRRVNVDKAAGKSLPIQQFWKDVDGKGTSIQSAVEDAFVVAGAFGHCIWYLERRETEEAPTAADAQVPRLCRYTPLDMVDWLTDEHTGELIAVKFVEQAPRTEFSAIKSDNTRTRVVDRKKWTLYDSKGRKIDGAEHGFGTLPIVILYGKRRPLTPVVGKPIIGDPDLYIDLYNLVSELRELLRNQTFAILNVPIGPEGDVAKESSILGQQSGTANVLLSTLKADYISPEGTNVEAYHTHLDRLGRMIYRLASVPWEGDSRAAEGAESRRLKRQELVSRLSKYAGELHRAEWAIVQLIYRLLNGEQWEQALETDGVLVQYPKTFHPPDLNEVATNVGLALGLDLGETATKELKKQTTRAFLPQATTDQLKQIDEEIDAQEVLTADERQQKLLEGASQRMAGRFGQKPPKESEAA